MKKRINPFSAMELIARRRKEFMEQKDEEAPRDFEIGYICGLTEAMHIVKTTPEDAFEVKKVGRWEECSINRNIWACSACYTRTDIKEAPTMFRYCPHCGADMRGWQ